MIRAIALAVLFALAPFAAAGTLEDLNARWNKGEPEAGHELASRLKNAGRYDAVRVLDAMRLDVPYPPSGGRGPEVFTREFPDNPGFDQAIEAVVAAVKPYRDDPERDFRVRADAVMSDVTTWKNRWSDGARASRRGFRLRAKLEDWALAAIALGMPLTVGVFGLLTIFWRAGALSLLFGASAPYRKAFGGAADLLRRERLIALLPVGSALVIFGVVGTVVWSIFANPRRPARAKTTPRRWRC